MKTPTKKALAVLRDSAARGGSIAAGMYTPDAIPTVIAMHLVSTGRANWQHVPVDTQLRSERQAPEAPASATAPAEPATAKPAKAATQPKAEA